MSEKVKISVIIPIYNAEKYLEECLNSVLCQSLSEIEVICIDDGSIDRSLQILEEYCKKDQRIVVKSQPNGGAGKARNLGLTIAKGLFVAFLDADDWYPDKDVLLELYNKAIENGVKVCGGSFSEFKDGKINTTYSGRFKFYQIETEGLIKYRDFQFDYGYIRFIYDLKFLLSNNIFFPDYRRFQDPPFYVRTMVCAKEFYVIPKVVYCYRKEDNKVNWTNEKVNDLVRGLTDNLKMSKEENLEVLHTITVERLNIEYLRIIKRHITSDNLLLIQLLIEANNNVDKELLIKNGYHLDPNRPYLLRLIKETCFLHGLEKNELEKVYNSYSYKIGRFVTFIPRKIRGAIICCMENGMKYTVSRFLEKIRNAKI